MYKIHEVYSKAKYDELVSGYKEMGFVNLYISPLTGATEIRHANGRGCVAVIHKCYNDN